MENEIEEWKPIIGYEGIYEVSNFGRVKALAKERNMPGNKAILKIPEKILKNWSHSKGRYVGVSLHNYDKINKYLIHRLVAIHFVDNPDPINYTYVRHLDDNGLNNISFNLAWGTQKMNMKDIERNGNKRQGSNIKTSLLKEQDIPIIRNLILVEKKKQKEVAVMYSVNPVTISDIINNKTWKHI